MLIATSAIFFAYWCTSSHNNGLFILFQVPLQTPCPSRNLLTIQWHPSKKRSTQLTNGAQSMENKRTPTRGWSVRSRATPGRWRTWVSVPTRNTWSLAAKVNTVCKFPLSYTGSPESYPPPTDSYPPRKTVSYWHHEQMG